jgi:GYD domain-containing protein
MRTCILLSTLTPEGRRTLHSDPDRLDEVNQEIADFGCEVIGQYAVLGSCDFVTVIQAPDNESVAQSMDHRRRFACSWNKANRPEEGRRVRRTLVSPEDDHVCEATRESSPCFQHRQHLSGEKP